MDHVDRITSRLQALDSWFEARLSQYEFGQVLVHNSVSKYITAVLFFLVIAIVSYETFYWSGIYLGLWEYHAQDIFKEVPIHCAHVYVRVNFTKKENEDKVRELYQIKKKNRYNVMEWTVPKSTEREMFLLKDFVKYHFEFSPEDFEENPDPEFGSTIEHLRKRVLTTVTTSPVYEKYLKDLTVTHNDVVVFNNKYDEVKKELDKAYLSKIHIETGNIIDCVVLI